MDDAATDRSVHAARRAVDDLLHAVAREPVADGDVDYHATAWRGHRARDRRCHERAAADFHRDARSAAVCAVRETRGRRTMEPTIRIDCVRMVPDLLVPPPHVDRPTIHNEALVLRRESNVFSPRRTDVRSSAGHLVLSRHALERMHERSLSEGDDLGAALRAECGDADLALAFAWAGGIHLGAAPTHALATTAIPFLDGMLVVQNRVIAMRRCSNPDDWREIRATGTFIHALPHNPLTTVPLHDMWGEPMAGHVLAIAATYVSGDMLGFEQEAYLDWFRRRMDEHAHLLDDVASGSADPRLHQELAAAARASIAVPDVGRRLIGHFVRQTRDQPPLVAIGWRRDFHPSRWRDGSPLHRRAATM